MNRAYGLESDATRIAVDHAEHIGRRKVPSRGITHVLIIQTSSLDHATGGYNALGQRRVMKPLLLP